MPTTLGFHSILFSWPISHFMPRKVVFARHGFHVLDIFPLHKMFVLIPPGNGEMKRDPKGLLFLPFFFPSLICSLACVFFLLPIFKPIVLDVCHYCFVCRRGVTISFPAREGCQRFIIPLHSGRKESNYGCLIISRTDYFCAVYLSSKFFLLFSLVL